MQDAIQVRKMLEEVITFFHQRGTKIDNVISKIYIVMY